MKLNKKISAALLLYSTLPAPLVAAATGDAVDSTSISVSTDSLYRYGMPLVWHDEFNEISLDSSSWTVEYNDNGNGNSELQFYSERGVSMGTEPTTGAHCLILTARREQQGLLQFTSGRVISAGKRTFTYGVLESRIMLPKTANGLWPAFWLLGDNYKNVGWPRCGEIDILEMGNSEGIKNGTQEKFFNGACHWGHYNTTGQYPNYVGASTNGYSLQDGKFHTFTLEWDSTHISMYVDRDSIPDTKPYYSIDTSDKIGDLAAGNYFNHDFFIIYNLAVGGFFTGINNPNDVTALGEDGEAKMYVDWVRLYQKPKEDNGNE